MSRKRLMLALSSMLVVAAAAEHPVLTFAAPGVPLDQLPGAQLLNPASSVREINITMTAARLQVGWVPCVHTSKAPAPSPSHRCRRRKCVPACLCCRALRVRKSS